ncbi:hypothetical protein PRZ48_007460 [Zasmidium cellare]|uniref:Uncharacterized protein n=1 Tax=Zasmidium cellare TaxID=395010 RepID=A0ABR0EKG8_ZASCE|nr:hypothetical protein PRZ48_007460 [Zasmidium cellare]
MGVTAMSHTLYEGRQRFTHEPDISVVTKHRISHLGALAGMTDCMKFCANRTAEASLNDDPTDLPCLGFLFVDKGEPNCLIFVEHTPPPQQKVEAVEKTEPVENPEPVHEREPTQLSQLYDETYNLANLTAQTLSALGLSLPQIGHKH